MDFEANPEENEIVAEQQEVPKEKAAAKTFRALKKRYGDWHIAVGCRRQLQKRRQVDGGFSKMLAAAYRGMTPPRAIPARRKGHCRQGQG
jgi:hypothetical protein